MTNTNIPNDPFCLILLPFYRSTQERISFDIQKDGGRFELTRLALSQLMLFRRMRLVRIKIIPLRERRYGVNTP